MQARKYRPEHYQYEETSQQEKKVNYHAYEAKHPSKERLKELLFFINIVIFSILTVISAYVYLSIGLPVFLAFLFAVVTGFLGLRFIQVKWKTNFLKSKKD